MDLGLEGRVAIVTGASAGLGLATATTLAQAGARVVLVARGAERLEQAADAVAASVEGHAAVACPGDVSRAADIERVVNRAVEEFGGVDILVNNAGKATAGPFLEVGDDVWQDDLDLKLLAAVRFSRLVVPLMRERGGGRIVNILNIGAKQPAARSLPTTVARAAGLALTKALSQEFAADKILVNAIMIGLVKSNQWESRWQAAGQTVSLDEWYEQMGANIPLQRVAEAEELADLVAFLVSDRARFITGAAINFDGGQSAVV